MKIGLHQLYENDPERADALLFGRRSDATTRRGFLSGLGRMTTLLGAPIVFHRFMPAGLIPAALADSTASFAIAGKDPGLIVLNDRPLNAETPAHLLDDAITPASRLFVRNNGLPPAAPDLDHWTLSIDGEAVHQPLQLSLADLRERFTMHHYQLTLECAGNGRAEFSPPTPGLQWTTGSIGCPVWGGVRLADVLRAAGITDDAVYIGYHGADTHLSGNPALTPISRGVPIAKALEDEALIAWEINGEPLPLHNGYPLRLIFGGWPASTSGKWLTRISVRDRVHDGEKMGGSSYRMPCTPIPPGTAVDEAAMCIIEAMPVKSLITRPRSGGVVPLAAALEVGGHAWSGDREITALDVSIDFGQTWQPAALNPPRNRNAWQQWQAAVRFPQPGYYEVWARATDDRGRSQPMLLPGWNPQGYLNNACHRVALKVV